PSWVTTRTSQCGWCTAQEPGTRATRLALPIPEGWPGPFPRRHGSASRHTPEESLTGVLTSAELRHEIGLPTALPEPSAHSYENRANANLLRLRGKANKYLDPAPTGLRRVAEFPS